MTDISFARSARLMLSPKMSSAIDFGRGRLDASPVLRRRPVKDIRSEASTRRACGFVDFLLGRGARHS
jgi:hypothetical protein